MRYIYTSLCVFLVLVLSSGISAQRMATISGIVINEQNNLGLEGVRVSVVNESYSTTTKITGFFSIPFRTVGPKTIKFSREDYQDFVIEVFVVEGADQDLGELFMSLDGSLDLDDFSLLPLIELDLDDSDLDALGGAQDISSILAASRDVFVSTAAFVFGPARFRIRGYSPDYTSLYLNGVPFNDAETGVPFFWQMGGLNDVLRNRDINIGTVATSYGFGEVGGMSNIDLRPSRQWAQTRLSYAISNRSYRQRLMVTHNTGLNKNGWAFSISGSRRWADEGYVPGTFTDAWAYFMGAEKKFNNKHSVSLVAFGAPTVRGGIGPSIQEMYDIAGNNYYNPNWGFQNGERRNARVSNAHIPMAILRHDFTISNRASLVTSVAVQTGRNGFGALNWDEANDPRPDYYQKLPSFQTNPVLAAQVRDVLANDIRARQLDFDYMYDVNRNNFQTIQNVDGIPGNNVSGNLAKYFLEERRIDNTTYNVTSYFEHFITDRWTINAGVIYRHFTGHNYSTIDDLLGADFYINEERFVRRDFPFEPEKWQNDLNNPNQILKEGDTYRYDYNANIRHGEVWLQSITRLKRFDLFLAGRVAQDRMWRTGNMVNGRFPDNSFGDSEVKTFNTYDVKMGITYKIDGRQYIYANGFIGTRAPLFRNVFIAPRTRDQINPGHAIENMLSGEAGYIIRTPQMKARATVYYTRFQNQSNVLNYFQDDGADFDLDGQAEIGGLYNFALNGAERTHQGVELAIDYKLTSELSVNAVASIGDFYNSNRPTAFVAADNDSRPIADGLLIYAENYFVTRTPQEAYSFGLNYRSRNYWFATINFNYFRKNFLDFNPLRRTASAVAEVEPGSDLWRTILDQERLPAAFTVDFFIGKSWVVKRGQFIYLNLGVGNMLNNTNFITGGFEQLRFDFRNPDPERFPPRYFYLLGFNYFLNTIYTF